jgi:HlyD family secretion protein
MLRTGRTRWRIGFVAVALVLSVAGFATIPLLVGPLRRDRVNLAAIPTVRARRSDLAVMVNAVGRVESSNQTMIDCELEALEVRVRGNSAFGGGASTLLEVVPEGTLAHKGDILCRLDASEYEEMARQQQIIYERAAADHRQAELDLEVAQMGLSEYRDGYQLQAIQEYEGLVALAESDLSRASDRLEWSRRMVKKGYVAIGQVLADEIARKRAAYSLSQNRTALAVFRKYNTPRALRELENAVIAARAVLAYQDARLARNKSQLENLELQIEHCTIRAPHDGFVIYATDPRRQVTIEPGMSVRQRQHLFTLPDLSQMEISTLLHESVVDQVNSGMRAFVRIEALPGRVLEGHVVTVARLPTLNLFNEVPYYTGIVKLDAVPIGLRPGMSAEVEIVTQRKSDVLTIPPESVAFEGGREFCIVAGDDGLHRREIKTGQATRESMEVTEGLDEGEPVVVDPSQLDGAPVVADEAIAETERDEPTGSNGDDRAEPVAAE